VPRELLLNPNGVSRETKTKTTRFGRPAP